MGKKRQLAAGQLDPRRYAFGDQRVKILQRDNYQCRYCSVTLTDKTAVLDHVIPWRDGGRTNADNLVTCCRWCNRKKCNRLVFRNGPDPFKRTSHDARLARFKVRKAVI